MYRRHHIGCRQEFLCLPDGPGSLTSPVDVGALPESIGVRERRPPLPRCSELVRTQHAVVSQGSHMKRFLVVVLVVGTACSRGGSQPAGAAEAPPVRGCNAHAADLTKYVACLYPPGSELTVAGRYGLLSAKSRSEVSQAEYEAPDSEKCTVLSARVLGLSTERGVSYGRVESQTRCGERKCNWLRTSTWRLEDGRWTRIYLPRMEELVDRQYASGNYEEALNAAERWLAEDPFSIAAHNDRAFSLMRAGKHRDSRIQDSVRAMLSINDADPTALHSALAASARLEVAKAFLAKIQPSLCGYEGAVFNVALRHERARARLAFLDGLPPSEDAGLRLLRVTTLHDLGRRDDVRRHLLDVEAMKAIRTELDGQDASFAASWAARLADAALRVGAKAEAQAWANFALVKNPSDPRLPQLLARLEAP